MSDIDKTYDYITPYGGACAVRLIRSTYMSNDSLAVAMENKTESDGITLWEPYAVLTVNVTPDSDAFAGTNLAFVDTNNLGDGIVDWLEANGIATRTGVETQSGYCTYPQVEFSKEAI